MDVKKIIAHYESIWGKSWSYVDFPKSSKAELPIDFSILEFSPREARNMWTYATCGMSLGRTDCMLELHIFSDVKRRDVSEILAACAYYHITGKPLGIGHTVNFGRPWAPNSKCDFGLISLPYIDGPQLELMAINDAAEILFLWLIPISFDEVEFKKKNGLEALEKLFEERGFNYIDPLRNSICLNPTR
jgi:hypothetical protein